MNQAGVNEIQPGIESLHTGLLKLMRKGVAAKQNIALLRYARACGVAVVWNVLQRFPGDKDEWYRETIEMIPLLSHLEPPRAVTDVCIQRFAPFFTTPAEFGITNVRAHERYAHSFPAYAELEKIAYHFTGDIPSGLARESPTYRALGALLESWARFWQQGKTPPLLEVSELANGNFLLTDTRDGLETNLVTFLTPAQAAVALVEHRDASAETDWGEGARVCVRLDGVFVPLATAAPDLLKRFEENAARPRTLAPVGANAPALAA